MSEPASLLHLCSADDWERMRAVGDHRPDSLAEVGYVHLSAPEQVHLPAQRLFAGRTDMVLLWCDPTALDAEVRWEPGVPGDPVSMRFPHLYGPLPVASVREVTPYRPGSDGCYPVVVGGPGPSAVT